MPPAKESPDYRITPLPNFSDDPFAYMDDALPQPLAEQHGSVSIGGFNTREYATQNITDMPVEDAESLVGYQGTGGLIEDQGDLGDFVIHSDTPSAAHSWTEPPPDEIQDLTGPSRGYGMRPHSSRGRTGRGSKQLPRQDFESKDTLPPIEELPTQVTPQPPIPVRPRLSSHLQPARSGTLNPPSANKSAAVPLQLPEVHNRPALAKPTPRQGRATPGSTAGGGHIGTVPRPMRTPPVARRGRNGSLVLLIILLLLLFILGGTAYFVPSADVTITLPARDYTSNVILMARPGSQANVASGVVPAETLTRNFMANGMGLATGSIKVGTASATGNVFFSNNGNTVIEIPTGTVVATDGGNGVLFATTADAVISPSSGSPQPIPVPIQAKNRARTAMFLLEVSSLFLMIV